MEVRLGHIDFLNVLPLTHRLKQETAFQIQKGVPQELNRALLAGQLDISGISSIVYARAAEDLLIVPKICVRTDEAVTSILLVSKYRFDELAGKRLVLTPKSETSQILLKILAHAAYGIKPKYEERVLRPLDKLPEDVDAALFIGDDALEVHCHPSPAYFIYDLGKEWKKHTGLGMVYSLWAVRRDFARKEGASEAVKRLIEDVHEGVENKEEAIASYIAEDKTQKFTAEEIERYLNVIQWDLRAKYLTGLELFYEKAYTLGFIEQVPKIKFI